MNAPIFVGLPSSDELSDAPQRAVLAALDANLILAVRALQAHHPELNDYHTPDEPLALLAEAVMACALSLHNVLTAYDDLAVRMAHLDCVDLSPDGPGAEVDDDIPF